ncbi:hypothetical protein BSKO_09895 [Bryopsis sp. KO-2023]|nr:hypothetical protein BSKO_09895 [Bryopsis sp. KO-2023]
MMSSAKTCAVCGTSTPFRSGRPPFSKSLAAKTSGHVTRRRRSRQLGIRAALSEGVSLAVSQQAIAFGLCTVAEGFYTRSQIQEGRGGRPEIKTIGITGAGFVLAGLLVGSDIGLLQPIGLIGGCVTSGYVAYNSYTRFQTVESDPLEWPGPRAWPVGVAVGSFFVFLALFQSLFKFQ